jgi:hypothetical protein
MLVERSGQVWRGLREKADDNSERVSNKIMLMIIKMHLLSLCR